MHNSRTQGRRPEVHCVRTLAATAVRSTGSGNIILCTRNLDRVGSNVVVVMPGGFSHFLWFYSDADPGFRVSRDWCVRSTSLCFVHWSPFSTKRKTTSRTGPPCCRDAASISAIRGTGIGEAGPPVFEGRNSLAAHCKRACVRCAASADEKWKAAAPTELHPRQAKGSVPEL